MKTNLLVLCAALCAPVAAFAQNAPVVQSTQLLQERNLSGALAMELAQGAVAACAQRGFNVSAAVVDRAGVLRAFLRADMAGPHTVEASRAKAYTSASMRAPTANIGENAQKNPVAQYLNDIPGLLLLGGGVPVRAGNEVVGAIGVGGAPAGPVDAECANAALDALKDRLR